MDVAFFDCVSRLLIREGDKLCPLQIHSPRLTPAHFADETFQEIQSMVKKGLFSAVLAVEMFKLRLGVAKRGQMTIPHTSKRLRPHRRRSSAMLKIVENKIFLPFSFE